MFYVLVIFFAKCSQKKSTQKSPCSDPALCVCSSKQNLLQKIIPSIMKLNQYHVITRPVINSIRDRDYRSDRKVPLSGKHFEESFYFGDFAGKEITLQ